MLPRSGYCERGCFHPHLHCVVPGGGLSLDGQRWIPCRPGFFLPVRVLSKLFRRLFLEALETAYDHGKLHFFSSLEKLGNPVEFARYLAHAKKRNWVVYAKRPFAGPQQVLDYVGRYTHRVAISNHRLLDAEDGEVRFRWKDYRDGDRLKTMTLSADEFIRRFLMHVLPTGFHRIRYYGFLGHRYRKEKLTQCRRLLGMDSTGMAQEPVPSAKDYRERYEELTGHSLRVCPYCREGHMIVVAIVPRSFTPPVIRMNSS